MSLLAVATSLVQDCSQHLETTSGQTIAVFGTGAVGLAAMMVSKISGCTTIGKSILLTHVWN